MAEEPRRPAPHPQPGQTWQLLGKGHEGYQRQVVKVEHDMILTTNAKPGGRQSWSTLRGFLMHYRKVEE